MPGSATRRLSVSFPVLAATVCLLSLRVRTARAEVALVAPGGRKIVGIAIRGEDEKDLDLEIYRGFGKRFPKKAIVRRIETDRSQRGERREFDRRLKSLADDDVAGGLKLAEWARGKGLVIQALALLHDFRQRFPENAGVLAALPVAGEKKSLGEAERGFLRAQVAAFFKPGAARREILEKLEGRDVLPLAEVEEWARLCFAEARKGPKVKAGDTEFKRLKFVNKLHIELWRRKPAAGKKAGAGADARWPVLIALHGGGRGSGHWKLGGPMYLKSFRRHFDRLIFVAPTVMKKAYAEWAGNPAEEYQVREMLRAVKRTWKVDTDRVYLAGYSMGGYGTWHIGGHGADVFAGLVSGAGGILVGVGRGETWGWGIVGNLMHTPIAFQHGGRDRPAPPWSDAECDRILKGLAAEHPGCYRYKYRFFPGKGHSLPGSATAEAVEWIARFKRNPHPKKIVWEPKRSFNRQFYWLRVKKPQIFTRLEAAVRDNAVTLRTLNLNGGFHVMLNRHLVDLSRPVSVTVNGKLVHRGHVRPTLSTILITVSERIDERQWFPARIDF